MAAPPDVADAVRAFAATLATSWERLEAIARRTSTGSYLADWAQANWEMIVEGVLPPGEDFLEVYGDGADCNGDSARVCRPEARPTRAVVCVAATDTVDDLLGGAPFALGPGGLPLEELVTMKDGWYAREPPFDCALLVDAGRARVVSTRAIRLTLGPATRG